VPLVVVDANTIVYGAWDLDALFWQVLLYQARHHQIDLVAPKVVYIEVIAKYEAALDAAVKAEEKALRNLHRLTDLDAEEHPAREVDSYVKDYTNRFTQRLADNNVRILEVPPIDVEGLVIKAAYRSRPFDANGNGFRDALVWESFLSAYEVARHTRAVFITDDNDFLAAERQMGLHAELTERAESLLLGTVHHFLNVQGFVEDSYTIADVGEISRITESFEEHREELTAMVEAHVSTAVDEVMEFGRYPFSKVTLGAKPELSVIDASKSGEGGPILVHIDCQLEILATYRSEPETASEARQLRENLSLRGTSLFEPSSNSFSDVELEGLTSALFGLVTVPTISPALQEYVRLMSERTSTFNPEVMEAFLKSFSKQIPDTSQWLANFKFPDVVVPKFDFSKIFPTFDMSRLLPSADALAQWASILQDRLPGENESEPIEQVDEDEEKDPDDEQGQPSKA
jgi:predicted nucleic acid-binding protein